MNVSPYVKKCERGHPVDSTLRCMYCEQEDEQQAKQDAKLFQALERLAKSGQLGPLLAAVLMDEKPNV